MSRPPVWPTKLKLKLLPEGCCEPLAQQAPRLMKYRETLLLLPHEGQCILYDGSHDLAGYPIVSVDGVFRSLHGYWWVLFHHRTPRGNLQRECHTPGCVNPLHWWERVSRLGLADLNSFDAPTTPVISHSENPHNTGLPSAPGSATAPAPGANTPITLDRQGLETALSEFPGFVNGGDSSVFAPTLEQELRELLIWKWVEEDTPRSLSQILSSIDLSTWNKSLVIKVLQTIPQLAALAPSGALDTDPNSI